MDGTTRHAFRLPTDSAAKASATGGPRVGPNAGQQLTTGGIARIVQFHLRDHTPKQIVRRLAETSGADVSAETARNWRQARSAPDAANWLLLCRAYPALAKEAERLVALEAELDPDFQRALAAFVRAYQEMKR